MTRFILPILVGLLVMIAARTSGAADEVLFEDNFDKGLAAKWSAVGLKKDDYRIKAGALEMRVRPRARQPRAALDGRRPDVDRTTERDVQLVDRCRFGRRHQARRDWQWDADLHVCSDHDSR